MTSCLWGLGYGVIDKRAKKLMRRMVATPMKKSHFLFSLITVRFMMNLVESGLLFLFAWLVFDVVIQGNIPAIMTVFLAGNLAFSGLAVFIASRTANTEIGNGLINAIVFPMMVLSGIFFSYHNFPDWSIPYIQKLPLTLLTDGIRSIFIEGVGMNAVLIPSLLLVLTGFIFFTAGLKIFKWY
jgi:ABC-type multidrug transport system permease subunit